MAQRFDTRDPAQFAAGVDAAVEAVRQGELVVLATESTYGIAADAFRPDGVDRLRRVKDRDATWPIPVAVGSTTTARMIIADPTPATKALMAAFWPGLVTIITHLNRAISWDVGGARPDLVSLRMPIHQVAWKVTAAVGPTALTGASRVGELAARDCAQAEALFGEAVAVYLDSGPCARADGSTVVDVTGDLATVVRPGAVSLDQLRRVAPDTLERPARSG